MKQLKKMIVLLICVLAMGSVMACGSNKDTTDGTTENGTTNNNGTADDVNKDTDRNVNDATNGTGDEGVLDDAADDVRNGVDDAANHVDDAVDDATRDDAARGNTTPAAE